MSKGVVFMVFGKKHNFHLSISFHSLRQHYPGPVAVIHDEENAEWVQKSICDQDPYGLTKPVLFDVHNRKKFGRGSAYLNKTRLIELMPFSRAVFLDCDTMVVNSFPELWPKKDEVVLTQFCDWWSTGGMMSKRIRGGVPKDSDGNPIDKDPRGSWERVEPQRVNLQLSARYPAINTGVMGLSKTSKKLSELWKATCLKNVSFICDEIAMQLIFVEVPHRVEPDYFNCSAKYSPSRAGFVDSNVRIWHFHGQKMLRVPAGLDLSLPVIRLLWDVDGYGIREACQYSKFPRRFRDNPIQFLTEDVKQPGMIEKYKITPDWLS